MRRIGQKCSVGPGPPGVPLRPPHGLSLDFSPLRLYSHRRLKACVCVTCTLTAERVPPPVTLVTPQGYTSRVGQGRKPGRTHLLWPLSGPRLGGTPVPYGAKPLTLLCSLSLSSGSGPAHPFPKLRALLCGPSQPACLSCMQLVWLRDSTPTWPVSFCIRNHQEPNSQGKHLSPDWRLLFKAL